ncbi:carboxylate-amine ligase [Lichenibacterium dinghuense]|uniref:carboxylate-amine ligase n=1 Tax=Lichenibacterium dinghuense TaxID=2895977 RepID=UPI001F029B27|nr:carboxylate-amine ligase [Lichenibacterium sp. 6Y81]
MTARYRFGIEEEFFLADAATRGTPPGSLAAFHHAAKARRPEAERELLQLQIETACPPTGDAAEARAALLAMRADLAAVARDHGLLLFAAGTHPTARWGRQRLTRKQRYADIARDMQRVEARNMVCGMHVHVEVPEPDARVDLMNRFLPFTPLLLGLSCSSPFWQGRDTGLAAYRMSVWGELPRTGLPDLFADAADFDRYVAALVGAGVIPDATFLWWTLRPSTRYPTLELRVADSCTRLDDALALAALYRCLVRMLVRRPEVNRGPTGADRGLAAENLWRVQRYGTRATLVDGAGAAGFAERLDAVLAEVAEDADALGCAAELDRARRIATDGTSADRQVAVHAAAAGGPGAAAAAVVDWLAAETARG